VVVAAERVQHVVAPAAEQEVGARSVSVAMSVPMIGRRTGRRAAR
jgi:hypothetical protein